MSALEFQRSPNPIWFAHASVAHSGEPVFLKPSYIGPFSNFLEVEGVILPLAEDGRTPDRLLLFVDFPQQNVFRPAALRFVREEHVTPKDPPHVAESELI